MHPIDFAVTLIKAVCMTGAIYYGLRFMFHLGNAARFCLEGGLC